LQRTITGISMPVIVNYELSPYSKSLKDVVYALINEPNAPGKD
jgi:hypothetical protein